MTYRIRTWDPEKQDWTPQDGVPEWNRGQAALRHAVRELRRLGYTKDDSFVLVEHVASETPLMFT